MRTGRAAFAALPYRGMRLPVWPDFAGPFPVDRVRLTSIYSKEDGVVRWQSAIVPYADCVEVTGSHVGLIFNRKAYSAIAATLAIPELEDPDGDRHP